MLFVQSYFQLFLVCVSLLQSAILSLQTFDLAVLAIFRFCFGVSGGPPFSLLLLQANLCRFLETRTVLSFHSSPPMRTPIAFLTSSIVCPGKEGNGEISPTIAPSSVKALSNTMVSSRSKITLKFAFNMMFFSMIAWSILMQRGPSTFCLGISMNQFLDNSSIVMSVMYREAGVETMVILSASSDSSFRIFSTICFPTWVAALMSRPRVLPLPLRDL
uniref:NSP n=2 Tax=H3N2 subtype TaxID=119210 RepID=Q0R5N2_9INFA|nr:NSP [Influenza A virus (A/Moscow/343/2003(H3N2))]AAZ38753.1 NSP [Influenza A virus (A/Moscow/343/2003(H3N2))]AAZ38756.1 NSP [Influenza A virus (A/Moscow/346/2003(H3N2))]AAZ38759.1 NSP [Influenza A virus (A/Moscow/346/2003(H3N2))]